MWDLGGSRSLLADQMRLSVTWAHKKLTRHVPTVARFTRLGRTYVEKPGSMLLKKDVHAAYSAFCAEHRFETTTNAAFGKMFKRVFPSAGTHAPPCLVAVGSTHRR